nr:AAA family ATPase [Campylobacter mucosalis]
MKFDSIAKIIEVKKNEKYYKQFSGSIENISCIVGKNGVGKTTFFELIIMLKLWKIDGDTFRNKIHALFYENKEFFIQSYYNNATGWKIVGVQNELKKFCVDNKDNPIKADIDRKFSIVPTPITFIFHSLSPFDRIYELIKNVYLNKSSRNKHYTSFGYIGTQKIKDDEPGHNTLTTKNLIYLANMSSEFNNMLSNIGYKFKNISIEINKNYFNKNVEIINFEDINLDKIDIANFSQKEFNEIESLFLFPTASYYKNYTDLLHDHFYKYLVFVNLDIVKFGNFKRFLKLAISRSPNVGVVNAVKNLLENIADGNVVTVSQIFLKDSSESIKQIINNKESIKLHYKFLTDDIDKHQENSKDYINKIYNSLKCMTFLSNLGIIDFKINLIKNSKAIDYLRLSSGEKTLLSYVFNIYDRILQLKENISASSYNKTFIILIDEVELHFHPEWQRQFIDIINRSFSYIKEVKIQFIIATHSPIILSDILSQNTIYLGIDNQQNDYFSNSFGGNILDIYKDKFFIEHTMGEFSRKFIEKVSDSINLVYAYERSKLKDNHLLFLMRNKFGFKNINNKNFIKHTNKLIPELVFYWKSDKNIFFDLVKILSSNIGENIIREHLNNLINKLKMISQEQHNDKR